MTNSKSGYLLERAKRFARPVAGRPPVALSETNLLADWQRRWESRHPEPYQWSDRRATVEEILDFLESDQGSLGQVSVRMVKGRFFASIDAWDRRGGSWYLPDGILPPECDRIRECLRADDHGPCDASAAEALIAAAVATVLHLRGVNHPIAMWNQMRKRSCLVAWLDRIRREPTMPDIDHWDAMATEVDASLADLAEEALFNAEFPKTGPSDEWIALLREAEWSWRRILDYARQYGYRGTKDALRARLDRLKHAARRKRDRALRANHH